MTLKPTAGEADGQQRCIVVAVDYGTTFSGVAWAQTARPDIQTIIVQWPNTEGSLEGRTSDKVPTELTFDGEECRWGFEIDDDEPRHQWFKLGLDPKQEDEVSHLAIAYPDRKALPPAYDMTRSPGALATTYLTCLRNHIMSILQLKLGDGVINTTPIRFTITVPAIWDDAAKARTQHCAKAAGMGRDIRIISEPEAAVVYALDAMDPHNLQPGDTFVLCDAGGGTVDLISYTITGIQPNLTVRETVAGSGYACGSTFLNRIFARYLEDQLQDLEGYDDDTLEEALQDFETNAKRRFTGEDAGVSVRVRGLVDNPAKGIKRQRLTISAEKIKSLFEPVMSTIITLVMTQLKQTKQAKAVILVGGFGQSPYLRNCLKKIVPQAIEVLQPVHGWTAVVRGALIKSLNEISPDTSRICIASRIARKAYGLSCGTAFDPAVHKDSAKYFHGFSGVYRISVMSWFVKQGDEIDENSPLSTDWYQTKPVVEGRFGFVTTKLYCFASTTAESPPMYPCSDAKKLVDLTADLSAISRALIPVERGKDGKDYYVLRYQIKVAFFSAHTEYSLWYKGVEYGKVMAEYA
ncbi:hypothetical protein PV11_00543 [Exophiala sideris]|uniref:Hsp70-like protein n=1 Tax=Exophiala sideris TaxID=1016849 RepID=A0A0D1W7R7_9EURO|nr:hypothetical protein PV11_00543 [Exophiala sideris]